MKISFILPGYPSTQPSGGYRVVYRYANELVKRGHKVSVIHPYYTRYSNIPSVKNLKLLKKSWRKILSFKRTTFHPKIKGQVIDSRVQLVYLKGEPLNTFIPDGEAVIATGWQTAPYVDSYQFAKGRKFHYVADYEIWIGADQEKKELMSKAFALPNVNLAMSNASANMVRECCSPGTPIHVVPLSIDHSLYFVKNAIESRTSRIVAMPYRKPLYKGLKDGLDAVRKAKKVFPDLKLVLFGKGPLEDKLDPWMNFIQNPSNREVVNIYNSVSVFIVPSWAEGWGLPGMEAMACGAALCSTDTGGVREYATHNVNALISPPRNSEQLAANIILLLKNEMLRQSIALAGVESIKNFNWQQSTDLFETLLKRYIGD